ncbi:hypothetical protein Tsubulata_048510 [Turnera subulata]|uniref:Serine/threonine protein phosphatase 2A regulatory subunit n=1 Tax=Turnera subulata TaxID=218843 RepID=A0A9Q0FVC4_9ROSI|nr:hypothetical protein Tsubulata_048510 [Turnera subulata]
MPLRGWVFGAGGENNCRGFGFLKKILSKLPKKSSKTSGHRDHGGHYAPNSNASTTARSSDSGLSKSAKSEISSTRANSSGSDTGQNHGSKIQQGVNLKLNGNQGFGSYEALPAFKDVPNSEKQNLFIRKLNMCSVVFDFSDPTKNLKEKEIKRQTLLELVEYVTVSGKFTESAMQEVVKMVSTNLFRTRTPQPRENKVVDGVDLEEEEPLMDAAWPHLQIVYEFFLRFVASPETDAKLAKKFIDQPFIIKLLELFDSEDPREREYLKTILHRIYGKFMLEEVLEATQTSEFQRCMVPLFRQIARCLSSSHFQVAERALFLWNNDPIENLITQNRKVILPIIYPALEKNARSHWNQAVRSLTLNVRKIFEDLDPQLFNECSLKFKEDEKREKETISKSEATWKRLEELASQTSATKKPVSIPQKAAPPTLQHDRQEFCAWLREA